MTIQTEFKAGPWLPGWLTNFLDKEQAAHYIRNENCFLPRNYCPVKTKRAGSQEEK